MTGQERIDELAGGYRASQILLTANRLGLFAVLADRELSVDELAASLESDPRAIRILCNSLVSLGLLEKNEERYKNARIAKEFLLPGHLQSKVAQLHHAAKLYERWKTLYDVIKKGRPAPEDAIDPRLEGNERLFAEAMADTARVVTGRTAALIDLSHSGKMLDLGGGPGLYSIAFVHRYSQLKSVIMDSPETLEVARENIEREGLAERITLRPGDAFRDDLGSDYDFVFLSNLVHIYSAEENKKLLSRCAKALNPGGRICIKDFLLDSNGTGPLWSALFAVNMLVNTEKGDCYTLEEMKNWFLVAGLEPSDVLELGAHSSLVLAYKQ
jgi:SAM-dependent methyltransferase